MLLSLLILGAQPTPTIPQNSEFLPLLHDFQGCVLANAAIFDDAKESVADTAAASFAAGPNESASIILMMNKAKPDGSKYWSLDRTAKFVTDLIDKPLADKITVGLVSTRARAE